MQNTLLNSRTASTDQELTVNLMADELHARGADLGERTSVIAALKGAGFRADRIEQLCESAAMTAWWHYRPGEEFVLWGSEAA